MACKGWKSSRLKYHSKYMISFHLVMRDTRANFQYSFVLPCLLKLDPEANNFNLLPISWALIDLSSVLLIVGDCLLCHMISRCSLPEYGRRKWMTFQGHPCQAEVTWRYGEERGAKWLLRAIFKRLKTWMFGECLRSQSFIMEGLLSSSSVLSWQTVNAKAIWVYLKWLQ